MRAQAPLTSFEHSRLVPYAEYLAPPPPNSVKRDFIAFMHRYRKRIVLSFVLTVLAAVALSFLPTPTYKGDAVMIIRLGPEYVFHPSDGVVGQPAQALPFANDQIFKSEAAILNSESLHMSVVKSIGVERLYPSLMHPGWRTRLSDRIQAVTRGALRWLGVPVAPPPTAEQLAQQRLEDATGIFDKHFKVALEKESAVINVSFSHPEAAIVDQSLRTLLQTYMATRKSIYGEHRVDVASQELQAAQERYRAAQHALQDFKNHNDVINFPVQRDALLARRNTAEAEVARLSAEEAAEKERAAGLERSLKATGPTIQQYTDQGSDTSYASAKTRLIDAEAKLKMAQARYAASSPVVALLEQDVRDIRKILQSSQAGQTPVVRVGRNLTYDALDQDRAKTEVSLKATDARRAVVVADVAQLDKQLKAFDALDARQANLEHQVTIARDSVAQFAHKVDNARALDDQDNTRADAVRIVQQPMVSPHPTSLQSLIIAAGVLFAALVMLAVAAWTEFTRSGFLTPEQLERETGLPVFGAMPYRRLTR